MKRLLAALALLALPAMASEPLSVTVGTNSTVVLPRRNSIGATWTAGDPVTQGQLITYADGLTYMALAAGTLPAAPDTNYRRVPSGGRLIATVQNTGSTDIWVSIGSAAQLNKGLKLVTGAVLTLEDVQDRVNIISSAAGGTAVMLDVGNTR